jgi:hypothetical protein
LRFFEEITDADAKTDQDDRSKYDNSDEKDFSPIK